MIGTRGFKVPVAELRILDAAWYPSNSGISQSIGTEFVIDALQPLYGLNAVDNRIGGEPQALQHGGQHELVYGIIFGHQNSDRLPGRQRTQFAARALFRP